MSDNVKDDEVTPKFFDNCCNGKVGTEALVDKTPEQIAALVVPPGARVLSAGDVPGGGYAPKWFDNCCNGKVGE